MNTNRIILAILLIAACMATTRAQQFKIGAKGGLTFGEIKWEELESKTDFLKSDNGRVGWNVGLTMQYIGRSGFGIDLSLLYARTEYGYWDEERGKVSKDMLDMPIHLVYHIPTGINRKFSPYLYTGPDFMFGFGRSSLYYGSRYWDYRYYDRYYSRPKSVFSWDVGIGIMLFNHLQIQGGFTFGLSNAYEDNHDTSYGKSRVWSVSAAVVF